MKKVANPAPLGLLGFGMTTILLNIHNAGFIPLSMVIVAMGITLGGLAQIIAGILEFKLGNTFGGTAFTAYGLFWWSLVLIWTMGSDYPEFQVDSISLGFYLLLWGVFTLFMRIAANNHNTITKMVFGSLALLFVLLAIGDFTSMPVVKTIAGIVGIICGLLAFYSAIGQIINQELEKEVLPL